MAAVVIGMLAALSPVRAPAETASAGATPDRHLGYVPLHPESYAAAKAAARRGGFDAAASAADSGPSATVPPGGIDGLPAGDSAPPDTTGAIGPSRYIELVNVAIGIYGRDGTLLQAADLAALTGHPHDFLADPQVFWDPATNRFYYQVLDFGTRTTAWGFSRTDSPTSVPGDFCNYTTDFGYSQSRFGMMFPDFPKLGASMHFLLIGVNVFVRGSWVGSDVDWIAKPTGTGAIDTCPPARSFKTGVLPKLQNADGSLASTPVPAVPTDDASSGWVVAAPDVSTGGSAEFLTVFEVARNNATGSATMHQRGRAVPVVAYSMPPNAPQPRSPSLLDTSDGRLEHAVAATDPRFGRAALWTAHAVAGGAGSEERWYELDPAGATVLQAGAVSDPSLYVWNGAISPDRAVNAGSGGFGSSMALGVNTSSASDLPAIQMVSKAGASAPSPLTMVRASLGPTDDASCDQDGLCAWGDYSGASPDPAPGAAAGAVWLANQWNGAPRESSLVWRTWISAWTSAPG